VRSLCWCSNLYDLVLSIPCVSHTNFDSVLIQAKLFCAVLVNINNQTIVRQSCYPEVSRQYCSLCYLLLLLAMALGVAIADHIMYSSMQFLCKRMPYNTLTPHNLKSWDCCNPLISFRWPSRTSYSAVLERWLTCWLHDARSRLFFLLKIW